MKTLWLPFSGADGRTSLCVRMRLLGIAIGLLTVLAGSGCRNLGPAIRLAIHLSQLKPGAPDRLLYRSGAVECHVVADAIWMDLCDYEGITAVEVHQQGAPVSRCELVRRSIAGYVGAPGGISYLARAKGVRDGQFTVRLRNKTGAGTEHVFEKQGNVVILLGGAQSTWPLDDSGVRIGYPVAAPLDTGPASTAGFQPAPSPPQTIRM